ncbi:SlyX family protein [Gayadomonas joobiniege]|uniref:SlyX family protein n=1 Tax=Gayadomonas joobiniege TaxID=1234606 RepID=UPI00035ECC64|nr:SlyX family protein [Gayadomonas joobiniege]
MDNETLSIKIDDLEAQLAFQEDTIQALNQALVSQQKQISLLNKQLELIAKKLQDAQPEALMPQAMEPPPPHY